MDTIKINRKQVKMVAHRGLSGLEKENTCSAFVAAGNHAGYYAIETDVHRTVDGQFIICHDDDTARVGGDSLIIEQTTFQTLRQLQLMDTDGTRGRADLRLPTLAEYVNICKKYQKDCVLELKNELKASDIYKIVAEVDKLQYLEHVIFISFQLKNLVALRRRYPEQAAQYLLNSWESGSIDTLKKYHLDLDIRHSALTPEIVREVHSAGLQVNCWTVNTEAEGNALVDMGADFITTNILE